MTKEETFLEVLRQNLGSSDSKNAVIQAVVTKVNDSDCTVKLTENDLEIEGVLFSATEDNTNGFVLVPKLETNVLIGLIGSDENSLYLVRIDEVQKVKITIENTTLVVDKDETIFNDGTLGGLVISEKVADELNTLKDEFNNLKLALANFIPVPNDGGAAFKTVLLAFFGVIGLPPTVKTTLENDKIKH